MKILSRIMITFGFILLVEWISSLCVLAEETNSENQTGSAEEIVSTQEFSSDIENSAPPVDETNEAANLDFLSIVNADCNIYTDPSSGIRYTTTPDGETIEVCGSAYEEAVAAGEQEKYLSILNAQNESFYWDGSVLNKDSGINYGPNGKETYYSLDMSGCVSNLENRGYDGEYWIREDGCKMYGTYILCAAEYEDHPLGSLVETSLGTAIVADTGSFSNLIDIATTWSR